MPSISGSISTRKRTVLGLIDRNEKRREGKQRKAKKRKEEKRTEKKRREEK